MINELFRRAASRESSASGMRSADVVLLALGLAIAQLSIAQSSDLASRASPPAVRSADAMNGLATVYSDKLNGRKTASGEVFRQAELTAAHPTLPFGTVVRVTNVKSQMSVEVRINDRGPKQAGRVIDLSRAAATKVGIGKNGMVQVKLDVVGASPPTKP